MRITNRMMFDQQILNINKRYEDMFELNEKVATGKRVNRPSDDPVDAGKILGYRSLISSIEQYERNIDTGSTWLKYTESALGEAEKVFIEAKTLAEQMATGTYSQEQRDMLSSQAEQLYDQLVQIANTKVVDRYIFSGFKTDTQPFERDSDFNISYSGDNNDIKITIQQNVDVTINSTGQSAFLDDKNVFNVLRDLRDALDANDQDRVGELLPEIDEAMNKIITERAYVGTSLHQMEAAEKLLQEYGFSTEELLSETEDTDLVEAVTELTAQEMAFEATLQSTSMVTRLTLVNFL